MLPMAHSLGLLVLMRLQKSTKCRLDYILTFCGFSIKNGLTYVISNQFLQKLDFRPAYIIPSFVELPLMVVQLIQPLYIRPTGNYAGYHYF